MRKLTSLFCSSLLVILGGCATGPCLNKTAVANSTATPESKDRTSVQPEKVRVFKPDGSKQCSAVKGMALSEMQGELKDVQVFSSYNKNDGQMRIQLCGSPTGNANVYEINKADLDRAIKFGFKEWLFE